MENPIKMGWFGGTTIFGNIHGVKTMSFLLHPPEDEKMSPENFTILQGK